MSFPYEIKDVDPKTNEELKKEFKGTDDIFVQVSPKKYILPQAYRQHALSLYEFEIRPDDIWVSTFPRSGTTLMQEIVWLIANDFDYETASNTSLNSRFPFIDLSFMVPEDLVQLFRASVEDTTADEETAAMARIGRMFLNSMETGLSAAKSPRFIKTHMPFSLLPVNLISTAKCIYVARNPKDVAVSYYYHNRLFKTGLGFAGDFPTYWDMFERDLVSPGPYWENIREAWELRDHPNMLFLFYEDIVIDWKSCIRKVASFLNKQVTEQQMEKLVDHMHIDNFRNNKAVNYEMDNLSGLLMNEGEQPFIRQGKNHGHKAEFTPELTARADKWIAEKIKQIPGFAFPMHSVK